MDKYEGLLKKNLIFKKLSVKEIMTKKPITFIDKDDLAAKGSFNNE